jgi:hypothetical protein
MASDPALDQAIDRITSKNSHNNTGSPYRPRSLLSISSVASGFSHEELVRPTLTFADDRGGSLFLFHTLNARYCDDDLNLPVSYLLPLLDDMANGLTYRFVDATPTTGSHPAEQIMVEKDNACASLSAMDIVAFDVPFNR